MTDQERDEFIARNLKNGLGLSDIQKLLVEECGVRMTYLDLRLLAAELDVDWDVQDQVKKTASPKALDVSQPVEETLPGQTRVNVSKLVRPGAALSGDVTFASGAKAEWYVDAMGRLGLSPTEGSAQPTQADVREFQIELQKALGGMA